MDVGLVCDSCSTFNPMGTKLCARCKEPLSLDEKPPVDEFEDNDVTRVGMEMTRPASVMCPACKSPVTVGHLFCGQCGARMPGQSLPQPPQQITTAPMRKPPTRLGTRPVRSTQFFGAMQASRAKLVVIRGDGMDGVSFTLAGDEHLVGRADTPISFEDDPFISPVHANFYYDLGTLTVRDENSENGVYIRIKGTVPIVFGARFLVGEQLLEVRAPPDVSGPQAMEDGTYYFASLDRPFFFQIAQRLQGGTIGILYPAFEPIVRVGREDNHLDFPTDPFISGHHARIAFANNELTLTDLDSKNGTFLRIDGEHALQHGDYVFMGQQLLRVEIV